MTEWYPRWDASRFIREYQAFMAGALAADADSSMVTFWQGMKQYIADAETDDDTSPEVPVTDLPDDVPNGDIGATEPEEPQ